MASSGSRFSHLISSPPCYLRYDASFAARTVRSFVILMLYHLEILDNVPKNADSTTVTLSNKPFGGEDRLLNSLKGVTIQRVGLRYMQLDSSSSVYEHS